MKIFNKIKKHFAFYRKFFGSFNPLNYSEYADYTFKLSFTYFMSLIFNIFIVMMILFLPVILNWPADLHAKFDQFEEFTLEGDVTTIEPIKFTEQNPWLVLNSKSNVSSNAGHIVIDGGKIYFNIPLRQFLIDLTGYSDVKEHRTALIPLILFGFVLMLPSLLLILYFGFAIKYGLMIIIGALIAFLIARMIKFHIGLGHVMNIAVFASTLTIVISIISFPLGININYLEFIPFAVYMVLGMARAGKFGEKKAKHKLKGGFIEVGPE